MAPRVSTVLVVGLLNPVLVVTAMSICATDSDNCAPDAFSFCCTNVPDFVCCGGWIPRFGFSVKFLNTPVDTPYHVDGFTDGSCGVPQAASPTVTDTFCFNECDSLGHCTRFGSAGWVLSSSNSTATSRESKECMLPDIVTFQDAHGVAQRVKIPDGSFEKASELVMARDHEGLLNL
ncbi:hypothetical protein ONZ45_g9120 [Pleurotus djamor]|nr:hypothetical protein ONZ45_g9120 [Pleurotus djamor]